MTKPDKGHFLSGIVGALAGALLLAALPAIAANGDQLILGTRNYAQNYTKIIGRYGLLIESRKIGKTPLVLQVASNSAPPIITNSNVVVDNLNADLLDGMEATEIKSLLASCGISEAGYGGDYECLIPTFAVPAPGWLAMSGSITISYLGDDDDWVGCGFKVDDVATSDVLRGIYVDATSVATRSAQCSTTDAAWVEAGNHSVSFVLEAVGPQTDPRSAHMNVIYIPG